MSNTVDNPNYMHGAALSDKVSDTTSQSGESDPEFAAIKAKAVDGLPQRRRKALLCALLFLFIVVGMTVAAILITNRGSDEDDKATTFVVGSREDSGNSTMAPTAAPISSTTAPTSEDTPEPTESPTSAETAEAPNTQAVDTLVGNWTTSADYVDVFGGDGLDFLPTDVPLFSVGNFSGLGNVISFELGQSGFGSFPTSKAVIGDPASGCVSVMMQVNGSDFDMMWAWNTTDPPEPPVWEMVGDQVCVEGTLFGSQVSGASTSLGSIDENPAGFNDWYSDQSNHFIASNPTLGTVSLYMYSEEQSEWVVTQDIPTPEGYEYASFVAEDDTLAISYISTTTTAMARSSVRSPSDARIDIYQVLYDFSSQNGPTTYTLVGEDANFAGVDVDTDTDGHVTTLGEDRMIRVYHRSVYDIDQGMYTQIGEAFEPARIFNNDTVLEEDLTVVKCDSVDIVLTAAVADTGSDGKKTLGIGNYAYYNYTPDAFCDIDCICFGTALYPNNCDLLTTEQWLPAYHGAAEFEPNPTREVDDPLINFNNKGNSATVATKTGFMTFNTFMAEFPMDFDLRFDPDTYVSHEVIGLSGWGVVSVVVKSSDGSEEIQNWMMSGC